MALNHAGKRSLDVALAHAAVRLVETKAQQVVYESQPGHFLWCSEFAWRNGQNKITPKIVQYV